METADWPYAPHAICSHSVKIFAVKAVELAGAWANSMRNEIVSDPAGGARTYRAASKEARAIPSIIGILCKWTAAVRRNPIVRDNLVLVVMVALYIVAIYGAHSVFGIRDKIVLRFYYDWFGRLTILVSALFILFHIWNGSYRHRFKSRNIAGFLVVFFLVPLFESSFVSYKQTIPLIHGFSWDSTLMRLDYIVHLGHHPWTLLEPILSCSLILRAIDYLYMSWFIVLFLFFLWMAWTPRRRLRLRFFISTFLVWSLLGSWLGTVFSSAGPCYYSHIVPAGDNPFAPLMLRLAEISKSDYLYALFNQAGLWESHITGAWGQFGGISAMPSIHLAMAALFALAAFEVRQWLGWVFVGYAVVMQIGSVILGWHYAVDGYAGILLATLIWFMVRHFVNWRVLSKNSSKTERSEG